MENNQQNSKAEQQLQQGIENQSHHNEALRLLDEDNRQALWGSEWLTCVEAISPDAIQRLTTWRNISPETWQRLKQERLIGLHNGRVAFPIFNVKNEVAGCHHRPLGVDGTWAVNWFRSEGKLTPLTVNNPESKNQVVAFESQWDLFAFLDMSGWHETGLPEYGFIASRGAMNGRKIAAYCNPDTIIYAVVQNDDAAKKWLDQIVKSAKCEVRQVEIPKEFKDLNDWKRSGATQEQLCAAIQNAKVLRDKLPLGSHPTATIEIAPDTNAENDGEIYPGIKPLTSSKDGRLLVELPTDNRLLSSFASDVGCALANATVFNRRGVTFTLDQINSGLKMVASDAFRTLVETWVYCYKIDKPKDSPPVRVFRSMGNTDAGAVLAAGEFLNQLRPLKHLNHVRLPVMRANGQIELLPTGYDAESQTYTFPTGELDNVAPMTLDEAKATLNAIFEEFCFPEDNGRSLSVSIAGMMTMFAYGLLPKGAIPPCFIIKANAEGAGKTVLVKVIISSVLGRFTAGVKPNNDDEVRKFLTAAVMEGRLYVVYDNVKDNLDSPALESFLTTPEWSDRILGSSKNFSAEKFTVVFITGNNCAVSPDMRRRSLVVELFMKDERAEARTFNRELEDYVKKNRPKIYAALLTLVQAWDEAGRPQGNMSNSSFPEWSRIIGNIVEHAGYISPLTQPAFMDELDRDGRNMRLLAEGLQPEAQAPTFSFSQLIDHARTTGAFEELLGIDDEPATGANQRRMQTIISRILRRYNGRMVGNYTFHVVGVGHARRYEFRRIGVARGGMPVELLAQ